MAGLVLNQVGEAIPRSSSRLVYLSAWMTACLSATARSRRSFSTGLIPPILLSDPTVTGALPMHFRSSDPQYRVPVKETFAADVDGFLARQARVSHWKAAGSCSLAS
jgi:hypothetical protein